MSRLRQNRFAPVIGTAARQGSSVAAMKVIVAGYMIRYPLAGMMMAFFHYVLGLSRLGHQVVYVEESGWPDACYDPRTGWYSNDPSAGFNALMRLADRFGLESTSVCYVDRESGEASGMSMGDLRGHLESADLLLNIGGTCSLPEFELCNRRALIDMDPLFTQAGRFGGRDSSGVVSGYTGGSRRTISVSGFASKSIGGRRKCQKSLC